MLKAKNLLKYINERQRVRATEIMVVYKVSDFEAKFMLDLLVEGDFIGALNGVFYTTKGIKATKYNRPLLKEIDKRVEAFKNRYKKDQENMRLIAKFQEEMETLSNSDFVDELFDEE